MIPDVGGGSTLSRMSSTLHYFDSTLFLFLRLARCLLKGGIAQRLRQSPRTHTPMSVTTTVAEVLLQS